jgi:two-component system sensor histidine kinase QseC
LLRKSLNRRFLVYLGLPIILAVSIVLLASLLFAREEIQEIYDTQLAQTAQVAASMLQQNIDEDDVVALRNHFKVTRYEYEEYVALRIWKDGKLLFATHNTESITMDSFPSGFSNQHIQGRNYRVFVLDNNTVGLHVEAFQDERARLDLVQKIIISVLSPIALLMISLPMLLWLGLRLGLKPLNKLSIQVSQRSPNALEPIAETHIPNEIVPLVNALNGLLLKLKQSIYAERQFTNLAAHELRTPLAVIQTQLDAVTRDRNEHSRQQGLIELAQSVSRASRMIGQLLALARLGSDDIPFEHISLDRVTRDIASVLLPLALKKHITFAFESDETLHISGNNEVLELAIRNLIDNAIKYTPEYGAITITVRQVPEGNQCIVTDSGSGIPTEHLSQVMERFYRVPGNREIGSGLGLTIVRRAAEIMQGNFILQNDSDTQGLMAILQFKAID